MTYLLALSNDTHAKTALGFANALIQNGHTIHRIFFFKRAVVMGAAEHSLAAQWQHLARSHNIELILCSAAVNTQAITTHQAPFSVGGLGLYAESQLVCDKVMHFG